MTRIISGIARGRRIAVPETLTRPTSDRAREGLFSSLQVRFGFTDATVADLFAGSGALGLEAASRGAAKIHLVETAAEAVEKLRANAAVVGAGDIHIHQQKVSDFLPTIPDNYFDMVLADPPYELADEAVHEMLLALRRTLRDGAAVVVERHRQSPETLWPEEFEPTGQKLKKRLYGIARMDMAVYRRP